MAVWLEWLEFYNASKGGLIMSTNMLNDIMKRLKLPGVDQSSVDNFLVSGDDAVGFDDLITSWLSDNVLDLIQPGLDGLRDLVLEDITTSIAPIIDLTPDWMEGKLANLEENIASYFPDLSTAVVTPIFNALFTNFVSSISVNSLNSFMSTFVTPFVKRFIPIEGLEFTDLHNVSIVWPEQDSWTIAQVLYNITKSIFNAIHSLISESADMFNEFIAGNEIKFPLPFFNGKALQIAQKIDEVWVPNENLLMPTLDSAQVLSTYPYLDIWPLNWQFPNDIIATNGWLTKSGNNWIPSDFTTYDLIYNIICFILIGVLTFLFKKIGFGLHMDKLTTKMVGGMTQTEFSKTISNSVKANKSIAATMLGIANILLTATGIKTPNATLKFNDLNIGSIENFDDIITSLNGLASDEDLAPLSSNIIEILNRVKSLYGGSYS